MLMHVKVEVWTNAQLKLDTATIGLPGSPTQVRRIFAPEREQGEIMMGEGENRVKAVGAFFEKLIDRDIVSV